MGFNRLQPWQPFQTRPARSRCCEQACRRPCPSLARPVAQTPNSRRVRVSPTHPAAQAPLAMEAPRKHQSPLVTKLLFCLPTMTSLRPKELYRPRNRPTVLSEKRQPRLHCHRPPLTMCSKYRRMTKASVRSPPREDRPRHTRIFSGPLRNSKRSALRLTPFFRLA